MKNSQAYFCSWHCNLKAQMKTAMTTQLHGTDRLEGTSGPSLLIPCSVPPAAAHLGSARDTCWWAADPTALNLRPLLWSGHPGTHLIQTASTKTGPSIRNILFLVLSSAVSVFLQAKEYCNLFDHLKYTRKWVTRGVHTSLIAYGWRARG